MKIKFLKGLLASSITLAVGSFAGVSAQNENSALGVNVSALNYWSTEWVLVDVMKHASNGVGTTWSYFDDNGWAVDQAGLDLDDNGWVRSLPQANGNVSPVRTVIYQDNSTYPVGDYTVLYEGEGQLKYLGGTYVEEESVPGRHLVRLEEGQFLILEISDTDPNSTGEYIRNIRVIAPGGICDNVPTAYAESADDCATPEAYLPFEAVYQDLVFHPLFLQDMSHYRSIRFMQMMSTNSGAESVWADRPHLSDVTWGTGKGVPIEMAIGLSNRTQSNPWLNIPARADDNYMQGYAELVRDTLDSNLAVNIELGNEIWNNAYPYVMDAHWMAEQGRIEWPEQGATDFEYRLNYFGKRTAEMCSIWKTAFGEDAGRVQCVMGGMAAITWVNKQSLDCPFFAAEENGYSCARDIHSLAIAPYFGSHLHLDQFGPYLTEWLSDSDGGLSKLFEEINNGYLYDLMMGDPSVESWMLPPENGAMEQARGFISSNKTLVDEYGIELTAYEGGQHLTFGGYVADWREGVNDLFLEANADPRMGEAYTQHYNDWKDLGGALFVAFNSTDNWDRWGAFSLKEYQTQPVSESPKLAATYNFIDANPCWWEGCERTTRAYTEVVEEEVEVPVIVVEDFEITVYPTPGNSGVNIDWSYSHPDAHYFLIVSGGVVVGHTEADQNSYDLGGLERFVDHTFQVRLIDSQNTLIAESNEVISMAGDVEAPSKPSGLEVVHDGAYGMNLSWNASTDNGGVAYYVILHNGEFLAHTTELSRPGNHWEEGSVYQVVAYDVWKNASEPSDPVVGVAD